MFKCRVKRIRVVVFLIVMMVSTNPVLASVTYKWFSIGLSHCAEVTLTDSWEENGENKGSM